MIFPVSEWSWDIMTPKPVWQTINFSGLYLKLWLKSQEYQKSDFVIFKIFVWNLDGLFDKSTIFVEIWTNFYPFLSG